MKRLPAIVLCSLLALPLHALAASEDQLLVNGGFEANLVYTGDTGDESRLSPIQGWITDGDDISWRLGSLGNLSSTVGQNTAAGWATYTTSFADPDGDMPLSFTAIRRGGADGADGMYGVYGMYGMYGTSMDHVSVPALSTVPEPHGYALMIAGFGTIALLSRRRRRGV